MEQLFLALNTNLYYIITVNHVIFYLYIGNNDFFIF